MKQQVQARNIHGKSVVVGAYVGVSNYANVEWAWMPYKFNSTYGFALPRNYIAW